MLHAPSSDQQFHAPLEEAAEDTDDDIDTLHGRKWSLSQVELKVRSEAFACKYENCDFTLKLVIEGEKKGKTVGYTFILRDHFTQVHQSQMAKGEMAGMICANCSTLLHATKRRAEKSQRFDLPDQLKKHLQRGKRNLSTPCLVDEKKIPTEPDAQTIRLKHLHKSADRHLPAINSPTQVKKRKRNSPQVQNVTMLTE